MRVVVRRHLQHEALVVAPPAIRSSSGRGASISGMPRLAGQLASPRGRGRRRRSARRRTARWRAPWRAAPRRPGCGRRPTPGRRRDLARDRGCRPRTGCAGPAAGRRRALRRGLRLAVRGCLVRSLAFGVGPLPLSCLRRWPPEPTVWPFFDPGLRLAPRRWLLPAISASPRSRASAQRPARAGRGVLDERRRPRRAASRTRSAAAQSLRARASARSCSATRHQRVDHAVQVGRGAAGAHQVAASGSRPSTSSMARTDGQRPRSRRPRRRRRRAACCPRAPRPAARRARPAPTGRRPSPRRTRRTSHRPPARTSPDDLGRPAYEALDPREGGRGLLAAPPRRTRRSSGSARPPGSSAARPAAPA